jgi:hypothetical protein
VNNRNATANSTPSNVPVKSTDNPTVQIIIKHLIAAGPQGATCLDMKKVSKLRSQAITANLQVLHDDKRVAMRDIVRKQDGQWRTVWILVRFKQTADRLALATNDTERLA